MTLDPERSLNGGRTRPLTSAARTVLARVAEEPVPRSDVNPGIRDRLTRKPTPLVEIVELPSPYKVDRGGTCPHLRILEAGRAALSEGT